MIELQKVAMRSHGRPSDSYEGKKLIVGRDIELAGEITACDRLVVEGKVAADLVDTGSIEVARTGIFRGSAKVEHADVSGLFDGTLTVRGKLIIRSTGQVLGTIHYARIVIELGGEIHGNVVPLSQETNTEKLVCQLTPPSAEDSADKQSTTA
ncbi:COG1664: Integral membrane protein CcmA involved in cell shape determination [invertebrate metagenome]|uniref:COG1664: Integral membrane protein CcmA involved in cell shape determination n=1 Tax=invertebrate metagenome TaxID=1711999 RepID=A0A484H5Q6_9ZZZZ